MMTAEEIKEKGRLVKSWRRMDGSWYEDHFRIYKVGDKYYQIKDHECISFSGTCSYWGRVSEVENFVEPTHICVILGQKDGEVWLDAQEAGTPEELMDWGLNYIEKNGFRNGVNRHLVAKLLPIQL